MSHYQRHLFFCVNQKQNDKPCCQNHGASELCEYARDKLRALALFGPGKVRVSSSGCLGRCSSGPCVVVYPDEVWYRVTSKEDVDEIVCSHLVAGKLVESLLLD